MQTALTPRVLLLASFAAAMLNLVPCLVARQGGDVFFHYAMIECFGSQLWQGDLYPRWCIDDNAGLGSAAPIFYFPLSYYIAALFYPLRHVGLGVEQMYICALGAANMLTFLTGWRWLADIVSPKRALMGAFLLLWMPYRMEVMVFRNAYAELWVIAFMPLLFASVRCVIMQPNPRWLPTSVSAVLCLLSHIPVAAIALMGCGIYSLMLNGRRWNRWLLLGFAALVAVMLAAVSFLPAWYFLNTISPPSPDEPIVWFNGYIQLIDFTKYNGAGILTASAVMTLCGIAWAVQAVVKRERIDDCFVRRELYAWAVIAIVAFLFSFEISKPLLNLLHGISAIIAPWRMRVLIMFATVYFFCVKIQWLMSPKQLKTWKMDYALLCGFFMAMGFVVITVRVPESEGESDKALKAHIVTPWEEGQMRWVDDAHLSAAAIESQFDRKDATHAAIVEGRGKVDILRWDIHGMRLSATLKTKGTLRLDHFYFPIWHALIDGKSAELFPEPASGLMMLHVPPGNHTIRLYRDMEQTAPTMMRLATASSFTALLILLAGFIVDRRRRHGLTLLPSL